MQPTPTRPYKAKIFVPSRKRRLLSRSLSLLDHVAIGWKPSDFVFVVSWMRSGSSLLSNLLLANDRLFGVGECHVRYRDRGSLTEAVAVAVARRRQVPPRGSLILDKILHNDLDEEMTAEITEKARFIFLVRDPEESAKSILKMWEPVPSQRGMEPFPYLQERLEGMKRLAVRVPPARRHLLSYNDMIDDTPRFRALSEFLGLPVSREYAVRSFVGKRGIGDFSEKIRSGRIIARDMGYPEPVPAILTEDENRQLQQLREDLERTLLGESVGATNVRSIRGAARSSTRASV